MNNFTARRVVTFVIALFIAINATTKSYAAPATEDFVRCMQVHTVQAGENLFRIARSYGTTYQALQQLNNLPNANRIYVGQRLCVESASPSPDEGTEVSTIVALSTVHIRTGPGLNYSIIGRLAAGRSIGVTGISPDHKWWSVSCDNPANNNCWVSADPNLTRPAGSSDPATDLLPVRETPVRYVQAQSNVHMRIGPGTQYAIIGRVAEGQTALVTGISLDDHWWRVICPNDKIGNCFVSTDPNLMQVSQGF